MGKRLVKRGVATLTVAACMVVAPLAGIAAAGEAGGSGDTEALATLKVTADNVSVQKAGKDSFKPAKDGQKLREGDTVKTDATGTAEIDYSDDAYTRLDVNTTFKIVKLTEEQGERQVEGSLEEGRTWNRTAAVTESGSFEQSGGGATAAVTGTAFPVDCTVAAPDCVFTGVEGTFILKGNGEDRTVTPFQQCGSTDGDLCDEVRTLTVDEIAAITWIQENLLEDLIERGLGDGPFIPSFTIVVEDGQVVEVIQAAPPATEPDDETTTSSSTTSSSTTSTSTTTTTTLPKPGIDDPPVDIVSGGDGSGNNTQVTSPSPNYGSPAGPASEVVTEDEASPIEFTINVTNPLGATIVLLFTELPDGSFGILKWFDGDSWEAVQIEGDNPGGYAEGTEFRFEPVQKEPGGSGPYASDCNSPTTVSTVGFAECWPDAQFPNSDYGPAEGTVQWSQHFTVKAKDTDNDLESDPVSVDIVVVDAICDEGASRAACDLLETEVTSAALVASYASLSNPAPATPVTTVPTTNLPTTTLPIVTTTQPTADTTPTSGP